MLLHASVIEFRISLQQRFGTTTFPSCEDSELPIQGRMRSCAGSSTLVPPVVFFRHFSLCVGIVGLWVSLQQRVGAATILSCYDSGLLFEGRMRSCEAAPRWCSTLCWSNVTRCFKRVARRLTYEMAKSF